MIRWFKIQWFKALSLLTKSRCHFFFLPSTVLLHSVLVHLAQLKYDLVAVWLQLWRWQETAEYFFFFPVCGLVHYISLKLSSSFMVSLQDRSVWVSPEAVWSLSNGCYWCVFLNVSSISTGRSYWHHFGSICRNWHYAHSCTCPLGLLVGFFFSSLFVL